MSKSTTPKPLTGVEVKTISSAPTGAKLENEPPKVAPATPLNKTPQKTFPTNHSAIKNSHKPVSVSVKKAPPPALPTLPLPPPASSTVTSTMKMTMTAVTMKNPVSSVPIPPKFSFVSNPSQAARTIPITTSYTVSKSANHNIHISPKSNNIGEQIKQQQQQQLHQQNQHQQQFLSGTTVTNCQVIVSQPGTLQMNNNLNHNRGVKRPQPQMTEMRKPQATFQAINPNPFYNMTKPVTPTAAMQKSHPIVMQQGHPNTVFLAPISGTMTMNCNNTPFTTNIQAPVVNGCKKPPPVITIDSDLPEPNVVKTWSVDEVIKFLTLRLPDFNKYESLFRSHVSLCFSTTFFLASITQFLIHLGN